ncbi:MGMT family protein [Brevibacterium antiquum]|uniref:MGMT family protein n=1 Tax=Brevibacterium antiquum TaxID=234835 RepID=UPI002FCCDB5B
MTEADGPAVDLIDEVRSTVNTIPDGKVASYSDIGAHLGVGPRRIGRIMGLLDDDVAWWRVVYSDGRPAVCHCGTAPQILAAEGTPFTGERVAMTHARHRFD